MRQWNDKQGIAGNLFGSESRQVSHSPAKRCGGQMRKRLDGGVHQGGCSGLGLGALESFCVGLK